MVAASAEGETDVDVETVDVEAADATETTLSAEEQEWQDKLMADVKDFLYVRARRMPILILSESFTRETAL